MDEHKWLFIGWSSLYIHTLNRCTDIYIYIYILYIYVSVVSFDNVLACKSGCIYTPDCNPTEGGNQKLCCHHFISFHNTFYTLLLLQFISLFILAYIH